jgi:hypothetical protein
MKVEPILVAAQPGLEVAVTVFMISEGKISRRSQFKAQHL